MNFKQNKLCPLTRSTPGRSPAWGTSARWLRWTTAPRELQSTGRPVRRGRRTGQPSARAGPPPPVPGIPPRRSRPPHAALRGCPGRAPLTGAPGTFHARHVRAPLAPRDFRLWPHPFTSRHVTETLKGRADFSRPFRAGGGASWGDGVNALILTHKRVYFRI